MPQSDLETLDCGGGDGDGNIACETVFDGNPPPENLDIPENPPDYPAESFYLSKEDEFDWFDRNAFYERKESTKGNSNSIPNSSTNLNSNSQRFSLNLNSKASIIGLPKPQKSCFVISKLRKNYKPTTLRFFPKRLQSSGKSTGSATEPSSPKVSCIGRVRSKKERSLRRINRCRSTKTSTSTSTSTSTNPRPEKTGFWSCFKEVIRFGCRKNRAVDVEERSTESLPGKSMTGEKRKTLSIDPMAEAPGLGGVKRFASGRRSDSWIGVEPDREVAESDSRIVA